MEPEIVEIASKDLDGLDRLRSRRRALTALFAASTAAIPAHAGGIGKPMGVLINASDFGVAADGVTDDAPALRRAMAAIKDGCALILPPGTIALGSPGWTGLSIERQKNICIQGNATTLKWLSQPSQATGPFGPTGLRLLGCKNASVRDVQIDGNGIDCIGLGLESCDRCVVSGVEAFAHGAANGRGLGQLVSCRGRDNAWLDCCSRDSTRGSQFRGFYLGNGNSGWGETDLRIQGCCARDNDATGFAIGAAGLICAGSMAANNVGAGFISGTAKGSGSTDHLFIGNISRGNAFHGWQTDVYGPNAERVVLSGNNFSNNAHCGALCHKGTDIAICGNVFINNGESTRAGAIEISSSNRVTITDNLIRGDAAHGVCISTAMNTNRVNDLIIANNQWVGSAAKTVWLEALDSGCSLTQICCNANTVTGGTHGLYLGTSAPGAIIDNVIVSNNIASGTSVAGFALMDHALGQSTNVRFIGNSGSQPLTTSHGVPAANANNSWNPLVSYGKAFPETGNWLQGTVVYNTEPSPGSPIGWVCTAGGTPGSWRRFGLISMEN